ncbi:guanylate binding protein [Cyclospora cayetanensis]|uniref:Guanylate binding protein n=1 Tax=Cyclospora cayetanensis TaxID=88456 RepID=A0A1D3CT05_9EIME|nr:guanylate binding protein [Cyclospora cayetanensis]
MFASPLPPGPDVPCVSSVGPVGFANATSVQQKRREEQHYVFQKYPGKEFKETQSTRREPKTAVYSTADQAVLQPLRSLDPDSRDLNLTASLEAFVAGVQGQQHKDEHPTFVSSELSTHETVGGLRDQLQKVSSGAQGGEVHERRVIHTMNDYGSSAYMQTGVGSVFPEAYANSYVVTKEGEVTTAPGTATSYQVVLSDGTSYPSAVFPAVGSSREAARSTAPQTAAAPQMYSSPARVSADVAASYYPYTEDYRRQFPVSPIVADSAIPGDDGIPAVSLPHERDRLVETNRLSTERHISPGDDTAGRPSTTSLAEPMLLVDGVTGLPLRGQTSIDRGTTLLSNPLANSRDCRLLTAKKKLLSRPMQLIHVNRWDGKEVLTVDEGARRWLGEISTRFIAVISICGELQTGKSGLANLLLDDSVMSSTLGFAVGTSVAAPVIAQGTRFVQRVESEGKTEGVWMSAVEAEGDKDNLVYLVLDFEGIGSVLFCRFAASHLPLFRVSWGAPALSLPRFLPAPTCRGAVDSDTLFSLASASAWTQRLRVTHGSGADRQAQKPPTPSSHGVSPASPNAKGKPDAASSSKTGLDRDKEKPRDGSVAARVRGPWRRISFVLCGGLLEG